MSIDKKAKVDRGAHRRGRLRYSLESFLDVLGNS